MDVFYNNKVQNGENCQTVSKTQNAITKCCKIAKLCKIGQENALKVSILILKIDKIGKIF